MKTIINSLIGLVLSISVSAEPLVEGRVRLDSGESVANAQVRIFDMSDLQRGAIARATTDGTGYFALPLASLTGRALPQHFALGQNYPNPFNPSTIIPYQLAASAAVRLEVFNLLGQRIATLVDGERPAGFHTAMWTATDGAGRAVGAGVYIYRMTVEAESQTGRMVLVDGQAGVAAVGAASVLPGASGGGPNGASEEYGLIVSGSGLVPYADPAFRVEVGMAPVELVVSEGPYSAGKAMDDDCALCDLFNAFDNLEALIVSASVSDNTPTPGQAFTLRARVQNQGTDEFQNLVLSYYRSADATISTQDMLLGTDEVGSLAASSTSGDESISLTAPSTSGTYYYGACVASVSDEGGTPNTCSTGVRVTVADEQDPVSIPDANLRAAIEAALGKASGAPITKAEMATLTSLFRENEGFEGIRDLTGLEFATNLTRLNLGHNQLTDISALSGLTSLRYLYLNDNQLTDISALSGLTNLTRLSLSLNAITDISALSGLTSLRYLYLNDNQLTDISALSGLTNLRGLLLDRNNISDISPLRDLTELSILDVRGNNLDASSPDHIAAIRRNGADVRFYPPSRESDFDIELVFLSSFTEKQKRAIQYAARRWMSIIREDLPDYTFTQGWSGQCGDHSFRISSGERIDDLRIYVVSDSGDVAGWASPRVLRTTSHLSVVGCMGFNVYSYGYYSSNVSFGLAMHEIGHVLGIGSTPWYNNGFVQESSGDVHFNGPLAIAAFNDAGGRNYTGKKVPLEEDWSHWRASVLKGELMEPTGGRPLSAITIQSLADIGYSVDVTQADPYTLPRAAAKVVAAGSTPDDRLPGRLAPQWTCGTGQQREPIHVVDPQGRIVRTLHR